MSLPLLNVTAPDAVAVPVITVSSPGSASKHHMFSQESEKVYEGLGTALDADMPGIVWVSPRLGGGEVPSIVITDDEGSCTSSSTSSRHYMADSECDTSRSSSTTSLEFVLEEEGILRTAEICLPYNGPLGRGEMTTIAVLGKYEKSSCCKFLGCSFELEIDGEESRTIGELGALIVNKSDTHLFAGELLAESDVGKDDDCNKLMETLFDGNGAVRTAFQDNAFAALSSDKLCYIDHISLLKAYRGRGLGRLALRSVHRILAQVGFSGPVVLSPATPAEVEEEIQGDGLTAAEREAKLIKYYNTCGYHVLVKGERWRTGGITVMARNV